MTWAEGRSKPIKDLSIEDLRSMTTDCPEPMIPTIRNLLILKHYGGN